MKRPKVNDHCNNKLDTFPIPVVHLSGCFSSVLNEQEQEQEQEPDGGREIDSASSTSSVRSTITSSASRASNALGHEGIAAARMVEVDSTSLISEQRNDKDEKDEIDEIDQELLGLISTTTDVVQE